MRRLLVFALLFVACRPADSSGVTKMPMPGRLVSALSAVQALEATAHLVPRGGAPGPGAALTPGDDGVSFSGFVDATPGDYTLEVVFTGTPASGGARVFLGRWTSNAFSVSEGNSATPTFTRPLDTIGRPEDAGDADADGLGMLDEILWSADPTNRDSDGDGVADGNDCTPNAPSDAFMIVDGATHEDCDGDGARRTDMPYGTPGTDCADQDASIRPGAMDDCADLVDSDCNPATCPVDDRTGPAITNITPAGASQLGCHSTIAADLTDPSNVTNASVVVEGALSTGDATLFMTNEDGDTWTSTPINLVAGLEGVMAGTRTTYVRATDAEANSSEATTTYDFVFDVPTIDRFTPAVVDPSAPFDVTIETTTAHGIGAIVLYVAPESSQGFYSSDTATEVGRATSSPATFAVDLSSLADGDYLLYATVEDTIGNRLQPSGTIVPSGGPNGTRVTVDYRCIASSTGYDMPARLFSVGATLYRPTLLLEHLDEATAMAIAHDASSQLVRIVAFGVDVDGRSRLDNATSYSTWLEYAFYVPAQSRFYSVTWQTQAVVGDNPRVDPDPNNGLDPNPILDPTTLANSDVVVTAAASAGCDPLTGAESDSIFYVNSNGQDVVFVSRSGGTSWQGTAHAPVTETLPCN